MPVVPLPRLDEPARFFSEYFRTDRAVVVTGGATLVPAFQKWTDAYLLETLGAERVTVTLGDGRIARLPFADYWSHFLEPTKYAFSSGPAYLSDFYIRPTFDNPVLAALGADVRFPLERGEGPFGEWESIFAGPAGTSTHLHQDAFSTRTWLGLFRGEKVWRLVEPFHLTRARAEQLDLFKDEFEGVTYEVEMRAGDLIFLPPCWWHQVQNRSSTLAVSGNFCLFSQAREHLQFTTDFLQLEHRELWLKTWTAVVRNGAR